MSSRGRKKAALYEKLQLLRSVTNSSAVIPYPFKHLLSGLSFSSLIYFYLCIDFPSAYENKTYKFQSQPEWVQNKFFYPIHRYPHQ